MKQQFDRVRKSKNYKLLLQKYFKLPSLFQKLAYSAQETILKENFSFLDRIIIPLEEDTWKLLKGLLVQVETMKPVSLAEICKLAISEKLDVLSENLSKQIVEKELIQIIDKDYLKIGTTTTVKVKLSTLKVFCKVLKRLEPKQREKYASVYHSALQNDKLKWRFRLVIVSQIEELVNLFSLQKLINFFMPLIINFCKDECYAVRRNATSCFWIFYKAIKTGDIDIAKQMIDINFLYFADYNRFSFRQSFIYMAEGILSNAPELVNDEITEKLMILSKDKVINVRLSLARLVFQSQKLENSETWDWLKICRKNLELYENRDTNTILGIHEQRSEASGSIISRSHNSEAEQKVVSKMPEPIKSKHFTEMEEESKNSPLILVIKKKQPEETNLESEEKNEDSEWNAIAKNETNVDNEDEKEDSFELQKDKEDVEDVNEELNEVLEQLNEEIKQKESILNSQKQSAELSDSDSDTEVNEV